MLKYYNSQKAQQLSKIRFLSVFAAIHPLVRSVRETKKQKKNKKNKYFKRLGKKFVMANWQLAQITRQIFH